MPDLEDVIARLIRDMRNIMRDEIRAALREAAPATAPRTGSEGAMFVSVRRAAEIVSVHPATIRSWVSSGKLATYKAGRVLRVKVSELEKSLSTNDESGVDIEERAQEILSKVRRHGIR